MNLISKFLLAIIFFSPLFSFAQIKKIYIDEDEKITDSIKFYAKCHSRVLTCLEYKTDTLIVNRLHNKYKFGKISTNEVNQIRLFLMKKGNFKIEPNKTLVIKPIDSIQGSYESYVSYVNEHKALGHFPETHEIPNKIKAKIEFDKDQAFRMSKLKKCIKKYERKYDTKVILTFNYKGYKKDLYKNINKIEYSGTIFSKILNGVPYGNFTIIKPDGEYFVSPSKFIDRHLRHLFRSPDWTIHKNDLESSKYQYYKYGKGIFKPYIIITEKQLFCF